MREGCSLRARVHAASGAANTLALLKMYAMHCYNRNMISRDIFKNLSCIDHRYSLSESAVFDELSSCLSEEAAVSSCARCEAALVKSHLRQQDKLTDELAATLDEAATSVSPQEVYAEEEKTQHNIRALVNVMKRKVPPTLAPLVHLGATSVDILDTAMALRMRKAVRRVVIPELLKLERSLCELTLRYSGTPQVGRTHGQHAVPITFGWALAEFVARLGKSILKINELSCHLAGKLSGPVGSYNGLSLITADPEELERIYCEFLGLEVSEYSNQLVEPEHLLRLLLEMNVAFGIVANLADDLRHLQRSEIGEVFEGFAASQVGSSTMPQKRNPWNSEHVKSLWKAMSPRVVTFYMDQISEHQRDLTNSASQRFVADYVAGFAMAISRMRSVLATLKADEDAMARNLEKAGGKVKGGILAESAYILLAEAGESNAHEVVRRITLEAESTGASFFDALKTHADVYQKISCQLEKTTGQMADEFFCHPANYAGRAAAKSKRLAEKYLAAMEGLDQ